MMCAEGTPGSNPGYFVPACYHSFFVFLAPKTAVRFRFLSEAELAVHANTLQMHAACGGPCGKGLMAWGWS